MDTTWYEAAGAGSAAGIAVIAVGGLVIAAVLVWAVRLGIRVKQGEPRTPRGGEHPTLPESGPVHEVRRRREPAEVPRAEETGRRLTPHELGSSGRRSGDRTRPRWDGGSGGAFAAGTPVAGDQGRGAGQGFTGAVSGNSAHLEHGVLEGAAPQHLTEGR
ncbi:DUF6479 family protein [Streptomyces sp. NPDC001312]|uniref:DUF6479 family protein n=1 Tax=Streptomyces sp. NPDC001312 TaxID=3364561 RepID=UPI003686EA28